MNETKELRELIEAAKFNIRSPYLIFLGEQEIRQRAKIATGLFYWRPELCIGQIRLDGPNSWDGLLPLPELSLEEAIQKGAKSLILGSMNFADSIPPNWVPIFVKAASLGLDIVSGAYERLLEIPALLEAAKQSGARLIDLRYPDLKFPETAMKYYELNKTMFGKRRSGKRCLAIGTDICVGKMTTMLAMEREMLKRGLKATFRATGQIGVLISGGGIAHDAIAGDYMVGTVECLTPANDPDHWDLVEGQASIFHPYFSPSTIALMYGAQPDALIICHDVSRQNSLLGLPIQPLDKLRQISLELCRIINPEVRVIGISLNTSSLADQEAKEHLAKIEGEMGIPTVDPIRNDGIGRLVDELTKI